MDKVNSFTGSALKTLEDTLLIKTRSGKLKIETYASNFVLFDILVQLALIALIYYTDYVCVQVMGTFPGNITLITDKPADKLVVTGTFNITQSLFILL
jgi:hypothetical protein